MPLTKCHEGSRVVPVLQMQMLWDVIEIVVVNKEQVQPVRMDNFKQFIFRLVGESPVQHFSRNHGMCGVIRVRPLRDTAGQGVSLRIFLHHPGTLPEAGQELIQTAC